MVKIHILHDGRIAGDGENGYIGIDDDGRSDTKDGVIPPRDLYRVVVFEGIAEGLDNGLLCSTIEVEKFAG
jgi:hypothetical protein